MTTLPLSESGEVTLDASGNGTVQIGPDGSGETWLPTIASVKCSSNTAEAACKIYAGHHVSDQNYIDGTLSGSTGDSTGNIAGIQVAVTRQRYVWAVWTGGDPGAQATLRLSGTKEIP